MYYNRPYYELIFLTKAEHNRLHKKDKCLPDDTKQRISNKLKGIKRGTMSEEHRRKLSESLKGKKRKPFSEESRRKMSEAAKNRAKITEETSHKQSETHKGL